MNKTRRQRISGKYIMNNLTTISGKKVETFQELQNHLHVIEGSCSKGRDTLIGDFMLNEKPVVVYKHWSYEGDFGIYKTESLVEEIGTISTKEWYDYTDENGNIIKDENGIYDLVDSKLTLNIL